MRADAVDPSFIVSPDPADACAGGPPAAAPPAPSAASVASAAAAGGRAAADALSAARGAQQRSGAVGGSAGGLLMSVLRACGACGGGEGESDGFGAVGRIGGLQWGLRGDAGTGASNNWVVGAARTVGGKGLLCNDPHLALYAPSIWFLVHIATPVVRGVGGNVIGARCVCVVACVCARVRACACVRACVRACARARVCDRPRAQLPGASRRCDRSVRPALRARVTPVRACATHTTKSRRP